MYTHTHMYTHVYTDNDIHIHMCHYTVPPGASDVPSQLS